MQFPGSATCLELATAFYNRVDDDPILRPLFPGKSHRCAIEQFAAFLVQFFDGPPEHTQERWWLSLRESHQRFALGPQHRDAWLALMSKTLDDVEVAIGEPARSELRSLFEVASAYLIDSPPQPTSNIRWNQQLALDEAVAAIRLDDPQPVTALVNSPLLRARFEQNRPVFAHFIGLMLPTAHAGYALDLLQANPDLAHVRYSGRTLLHASAAAGNLPVTEQLLGLGVDPNIQTDAGHTPLYCLGNECPTGGPVVKFLIEAGANPNAADGVKRCTPLHMAARRNNVEAAEALLDLGADIEARDSAGDTPLRRAVNCSQSAVTKLLLARGANKHSLGSSGLTPVSAARGRNMRALLQA